MKRVFAVLVLTLMLSGCGVVYDAGEGTYETVVEGPAYATYTYITDTVSYVIPDTPEGPQPHPQLGMLVHTKLGTIMNKESYGHLLYVFERGNARTPGYYWYQGNRVVYVTLNEWNGPDQPCREFDVHFSNPPYSANGLTCQDGERWTVNELFHGAAAE